MAYYDAIAEEYKKSKLQPWRLHVELFDFFELLGDLRSKSVLDLACGEGFHTRHIKKQGAARVVGVDVSERMVELARQEEAQKPLGIEYVVCDAMQLDLPERFDVVAAAYLLNYARTREELAAMAAGIARHLKPGGRFVTVNNNPRTAADPTAMEKYGFSKNLVGRFGDGATIRWTFLLDGQTFSIDNCYLSVATHEQVLGAAGLTDLRWHQPRVAPAGEREFGVEFWRDFIEHAPITLLEGIREA